MVTRSTTTSPGFSTFNEAVRWRAIHEGERLACRYLDSDLDPHELTYAQLDLRARAVAAELAESETRGERALLLVPPGFEAPIGYVGAAYAGTFVVPVDVPRPGAFSPRLESVSRDARPRFVLCSSLVADHADALIASYPALAGARWIAVDAVPDARAAEMPDPDPLAGEDVLMLQYTSGSTTRPKGAVITHGGLVVNSEDIARGFGHGPESSILTWLPHYHDMGLIGGILHPLVAGMPATLMSPLSFVQRPVRWLRAISRYRTTTSGAPNFAYDLCARRVSSEQKEGLDLSSWDVAFNGAEPVRPETLERFAKALAECGLRREALFPCYGLAEFTLFVCGGPKEQEPRVRERPGADDSPRSKLAELPLVSCGPVPRDRLAIVDPETRLRRPDGAVGEVWLTGPTVAQGYWQRPEETFSRFAARIEGESAAYFRTGDLGFIEDDELFICGRVKEILIIRGVNHHPEDLERTVDGSHDWLETRRSVAFAVARDAEERLVVGIELQRNDWEAWQAGSDRFDAKRLVEDVRAQVVRRHGIRVEELLLLPPRALPLTTSGKVRRNDCRDAYLAGRLDARPAAGPGGV